MPHDAVGRQRRVRSQQGVGQLGQREVLRVRIRCIVDAFELDTDREVIAMLATEVARLPGMPGPRTEGHILADGAIAPDQRMRRHAQRSDALEIRMRIRREGSGKQSIDPRVSIFARWQADAMHDEQLRPLRAGSGVEVWRQDLADVLQQAGGRIDDQWRTLRHAAMMPESMDADANLSLVQRDLAHVWHPCTQMKDHESELPLLPIVRGRGAWLEDAAGKRYFDAISSWWVNLFGHAHPRINAAIRDQLERIEHVLLAGFTHEPVIALSEELVQIAPRGLTRCFYADSGSAAIEIALKMSFHYWQNTGRPRKTRFVTLANSYHGETLGALAVGNVELFKATYRPLLMDVLTVPSPDAYLARDGESAAACAQRAAQVLDALLADRGDEIAAVLIEPLVQCAGNMRMHDPEYLRLVRAACDRHQVHLIADEIAVGFGRTGTMFACEQGHISPDFLCLSKGLSGGYLPISVVMTTEQVYAAFYDDFRRLNAFLHSHSYSGNPLACAAARATLAIFRDEPVLENIGKLAAHLRRRLAPLAEHPQVTDVRQHGLIAAVEFARDRKSREPFDWTERRHLRIYRHALSRGVLLRPLGSVVYFMPPYVTTPEEIDLIVEVAREGIELAVRDDA